MDFNTVPVRFRTNEPALSLAPNGPWAESITVPAGHASFFREPANPGGLVLSAAPLAGGDAALGTSGIYAELTVPGAVAKKSTPKPKPVPKVVSAVPAPTLKIVAPARKLVGQPIPATITILRNGTPDAHAVVSANVTAGKLSQESGLTNARGQIHVVVTHAPVGPLIITAATGKAHGRAVVQVVKSVSSFAWWSLLVLLGLVLLGILLVVAMARQRQRRAKAIGE